MFFYRSCVKKFFLVGMEMVAMVVQLIYEERERDAPCATSSRVEGVRVCFVFLYRNTVFLRPWQIDPGYDTASPRVHTTSNAYLSFDSRWQVGGSRYCSPNIT